MIPYPTTSVEPPIIGPASAHACVQPQFCSCPKQIAAWFFRMQWPALPSLRQRTRTATNLPRAACQICLPLTKANRSFGGWRTCPCAAHNADAPTHIQVAWHSQYPRGDSYEPSSRQSNHQGRHCPRNGAGLYAGFVPLGTGGGASKR